MRVRGRNGAFEHGQYRLVRLDADHELGALHRCVQIGRVDLERAGLPAKRLECAFRQVEQGRLTLIGGDIGEMHRRVLVDAQHGLIDEHDRGTAERARAHRILRAKRLIEGAGLPRSVAAYLDLAVDRIELAYDRA